MTEDPNPLSVALAAIRELERFAEMAWIGLDYFCTAVTFLEVQRESVDTLGKRSPWHGRKITDEDERKARQAEEYGSQQRADGFPYLYHLATVKLWSILESMVDDLLLKELRNPSGTIDHDSLDGLKGPIMQFWRASEDDQLTILASEIKRNLRSPLQRGVGKLESVLAVLGLGGSVVPEARRCLFELSETRNCLVHRNGVADKKLVESLDWLTISVGDRLQIPHLRFDHFVFGAHWYVLEVNARTARSLGMELTQGAEKAQQTVLARLRAQESEREGQS